MNSIQALLFIGLKNTDMNNYLLKTTKKFNSLFKAKPSYIARAPGRAEIIGNHTDYNFGYALGAAISQSSFTAVSMRNDDQIALYSANFDQKIHTFTISDIDRKRGIHWTNYVKAVSVELARLKPFKHGFNMYIQSDVPSSGGVSSSASLELSVGLSLLELYKIDLSMLELAILCQRAENGPLVGSPCGFLDQGTSALSKKDNLLYLDFLPQDDMPVSKTDYIPVSLTKHGLSFLIAVDKKVKRNLGESEYPKRRRMCEESLPVLSQLLGRRVRSLREIKGQDFRMVRDKLEKKDSTMRKRVEHIVTENKRVQDSAQALINNDMVHFGKLLTESGNSALTLYDLVRIYYC